MPATDPGEQPKSRVRREDFYEGASFRISFWGLVIVGTLGIILAFNAAFDGSGDSLTGAGICLVASALAFIGLGRVFRRRRGMFGPGRSWDRVGRRRAEQAMRERKGPQRQIDLDDRPES